MMSSHPPPPTPHSSLLPRAHSSCFFRRPAFTAEWDLKRSQVSACNLAFIDASRFVSGLIVVPSGLWELPLLSDRFATARKLRTQAVAIWILCLSPLAGDTICSILKPPLAVKVNKIINSVCCFFPHGITWQLLADQILCLWSCSELSLTPALYYAVLCMSFMYCI